MKINDQQKLHRFNKSVKNDLNTKSRYDFDSFFLCVNYFNKNSSYNQFSNRIIYFIYLFMCNEDKTSCK